MAEPTIDIFFRVHRPVFDTFLGTCCMAVNRAIVVVVMMIMLVVEVVVVLIMSRVVTRVVGMSPSRV